jgi:hypothetical protein
LRRFEVQVSFFKKGEKSIFLSEVLKKKKKKSFYLLNFMLLFYPKEHKKRKEKEKKVGLISTWVIDRTNPNELFIFGFSLNF